eukprot:Gb_15534 [translate_table: standard]
MDICKSNFYVDIGDWEPGCEDHQWAKNSNYRCHELQSIYITVHPLEWHIAYASIQAAPRRCLLSTQLEGKLISPTQERNCGSPAAAATTDQVQRETNQEKHTITENAKTPETCNLHASIPSMDCNERSRWRPFHPVSDSSSSSSQDSVIPALEPSSSLASGCSKKGKVTGHFDDNCCFNCSSSNGDHSNVQLRRATSLGSLEAYSVFARRLRCQRSNVDQNQGFHVDYLRNDIAAQDVQENRLLAESESTLSHRTIRSTRMRPRQYSSLPFDTLEWRDAFSESTNVIQTENMDQPHVMASNSNQNIFTMRRSSSMTMEAREARHIQSRSGAPEHAEGNVSFRRTHSVGRIRDRVLRRTTSEVLFGMPQGDAMGREMRQHNGRRFWDALSRASSLREVGTPATAGQYQFFRTLRSMNDNRRHREERFQMNGHTPTNNGNFVENRSLYLEERRRRARSQVRALQRLSHSFENLAGHERSCIFAGDHHTGHCTCQNIGRTDESNTRASISRIIMLAEAMFEVLDEIHSQSMALSSQPSAVSLGSFPAPDYVVESMPVRIYAEQEIIGSEEAAHIVNSMYNKMHWSPGLAFTTDIQDEDISFDQVSSFILQKERWKTHFQVECSGSDATPESAFSAKSKVTRRRDCHNSEETLELHINNSLYSDRR